MSQEVEVKIKVDTAKAVTDVNKLGDAFDNTAQDAQDAQKVFSKAGNGVEVEQSIAGLKQLKRELKNTAVGSAEFKKLYNDIDDLEDKLKSAKNTSSDWVDSLEQAGGPIGMLGAGLNRAKVATQSFGGALKATGIGLIVALLGGLAVAFSNNEGAMKKLQPLLDGVGKIFQGVFRAVEPLFNTLVDLAINALPMVSKAFAVVYSSVTSVFQSLGKIGGAIGKLISGDFSGAWQDAKSSVNDFGKNYDSSIKSFDDLMYVISNFDESREDFKRRFRVFKNNIPNNTINRLYPLLIELGFDAIDYIDPSGRRGQTSDYEEFQETSGMSSRTKKKKNKLIDKKNILIINRSMITMPDLFQKARLRPETLTEEEKIKLKDEQQTTAIEYSKALIDSDADIHPKFQEIIDALNGGTDPQKVLNYIKKIEYGFISFEDKLNFLLEIKKYYNENIIFTIFTNQEIIENKQKIRSYIGDYGKGKAVGFASNYMEATEKLLRKFSQKYLIDGQANPSLNLEQTIFALEEYGKIQKLLEMSQKDFGHYPNYKHLLSNHFISLISQINSFDSIFQLVNDMELRANLTKDAIMAMINKQEELRNQTAKVAYKVRIRYVV